MYTVEIVKDRFWIVEDAGIKLGLIRKTQSSDFEVIIREDGFETLSLDALTSKFGSKILESKQVKKIESVEYGKDIDEVNGVPTKHKAFNKQSVVIAEKDIPTYTKTEKVTSCIRCRILWIKIPRSRVEERILCETRNII